MQRSKQHALMFLLGAALVGGALGFSADRYLGHEKFASSYGPRSKFYDDLGLTVQQRAMIDSLSFQHGCAVKAVLAPHDSVLKVIRANFETQWRQVLTKEQLAKYDARDQEVRARRDKEPKRTCSGN